jgi:putative transposase
MSSLVERRALLALLTDACDAGARLAPACAQIGLSERTVQRWQRPAAGDDGDLRASTRRVATPPPNRLSDIERQAALALLNGDEFKDLPPSQIVPRLADQGRFVASESTLYRLLRGAGQLTHRRAERAPQHRSRPRALAATRPDQIYCWDISYLPTEVRGVYFYLYLFVDLFSRKIVGWAGVRQRERGAGWPVVDRHLCAPADRPSTTDAAFRQRRPDEGRGDAGHAAAPGRGGLAQSTGREQRQPVLRGLVPHAEVPASASRQTAAKPAARASLGDAARALVQPRAPAQRDRLRDAASAPSADRSIAAKQSRCGLRSSTRSASLSMVRRHSQLDSH